MAANDVPCCETMFWVYLAISVALVAFAGLMSGLTLGLMSLSLVDLEVLIKAGQPQDRKNAEKILPIVKNQHLLLCTLLICNSLAMEALPIFIDALLPAWGAILISVTLILTFGEIIPQAVCSRYGLSIGARLSVLVRLLVIIVFPLSYPISKLLDFLLGKGHSVLLRRAELKTFVDMHANEAGKGGELTYNETTIISGALDLTQKTAKDAMTPLYGVFSLDLNTKLDNETMSLIISKGHSRVPVYSRSPSNIVGLVLVKNLIKCHPEDETPIRDLTIRRIPRFLDCLPLYDILNQFQKGQSHMAVVVNSNHTKEAAERTAQLSDVQMINSSPNLAQRQAAQRGMNCFCGHSKQVNMLRQTLPAVASRSTVNRSPGSEVTIISDGLESSTNIDEEVIGIITMEDVLEQLLQVVFEKFLEILSFWENMRLKSDVSKLLKMNLREKLKKMVGAKKDSSVYNEPIFDETDEYVDVHNKIKINLIPSVKLSSKSPGIASASQPNRQVPVSSPISSTYQTPISCHHTPTLRSPISPYTQSPLTGPTLSASPGNSAATSPVGFTRPFCSSPSTYQRLR